MKKLIMSVLLCISVTQAHAGMDDEIVFGWLPAFASVNVNDPDGPTGTETRFDALNAVIIIPWKHDFRIWTEVFTQEITTSASTTNIGQKVNRWGGKTSLQKRLRIARTIKPWAGIGIEYTTDSYKTRVTVDSDGFLQKRYPDRDANNLGLVLNLTGHWEFLDPIEIALHGSYTLPLNDGTEEMKVGVGFLYKFE